MVLIAGAAGGHSAELVVEALSDLGELDLTRVAMQPGSAQGFGLLGPDRVPTFLLPANPVSALVVFEVIVRPVLRIMLGRRNPYRRTVMARTLEPITSPVGRRQFLRGQLMRDDEDDYLVHILGGSGTHLLASLAEANCLVLVDEDTTRSAGGQRGSGVVPGAAGLTMSPAGFPAGGSPEHTRLAGAARAGADADRQGRRSAAAPVGLGRLAARPAAGRGADRAAGMRPATLTWAQRHSRAMWHSHRALLRSGARRGEVVPFAITVDGTLRRPGDAGRHPARRAAVRLGRVLGRLPVPRPGSRDRGGCADRRRTAFGPVGLHRMEATIAPENLASRAVVAHLGFPAGGTPGPVPRHRRRLAGPPAVRAHRRGGAARARPVAGPLAASGPVLPHPARAEVSMV